MFYPVKNFVFNRVYAENPKDFQKSASQSNTALLVQGGADIFSETRASSHSKDFAMQASPAVPENREFVVENTSASKNATQTFSIILPNLIHKSRKRNLNR